MESLTHHVQDYLADCRLAGTEPDWALLRFFNDIDRVCAQPLPASLTLAPRWKELIGRPTDPAGLLPLLPEMLDDPWWENTGWQRWYKRVRQWPASPDYPWWVYIEWRWWQRLRRWWQRLRQ